VAIEGQSQPHGGKSMQVVSRAIVDEIWDDRADQDAIQLVALLFVAANPLRKVEVAETLRVSPARLARACSVLRANSPRGSRLEESGGQLVSFRLQIAPRFRR
jgi:chromosome segregation and condensation protein ScpB